MIMVLITTHTIVHDESDKYSRVEDPRIHPSAKNSKYSFHYLRHTDVVI